MPNILVTGAGGQLGSEFKQLSTQIKEWNFICPTRQELDISDKASVDYFFNKYDFDYCLNTAAYTAVDKAETEEKQAYKINQDAAFLLAKNCLKHDCQLIHFSTDYVYKSGIERPLIETDPTLPQGVYAASKLAGDESVLAISPSAMIVRTSWVYSVFGNNFVKTMLRLGQERDQLGIVFDQIGTPTNAADLAVAIIDIIKLIEKGDLTANSLGGIYHYSNEGVCSWYDFALAIFELAQIKCDVSPIESKEYPTPATRPHFSVLNKSKIKNAFGITIPHWRVSLEKCIAQLTDS